MKHLLAVIFVAMIAVVAMSVGSPVSRAAADEGWTIAGFAATIDVQADGSLLIAEAIDVDFGSLEKRGIFREIPIEYDYNSVSS